MKLKLFFFSCILFFTLETLVLQKIRLTSKKSINLQVLNEKIHVLIIAAFFDSNVKNIAIWSQLECFGKNFQKIVIAAPIEHKHNVTDILTNVKQEMPDIYSRIKTSFHINDRYDAGLWCDSLDKDTNKTFARKQEQNYLLINDSLLIIKKMNYIPSVLENTRKDLLSLNYWDIDDNYWVESPFRLFSSNGMNVFRDKVCSLGVLNWRQHCPHLKKYKGKWHMSKFKKRCIVEKTEIDLSKYFNRSQVDGLFPGYSKYRVKRPDGRLYRHWAEDYRTWKKLFDENFPVIKTTKEHLIIEFFNSEEEKSTQCLSLLPKKYKFRLNST